MYELNGASIVSVANVTGSPPGFKMAEVEQKLTQFTYEYEKNYQKYYSYF